MSVLNLNDAVKSPIVKEVKAEQKKQEHHGSLKMHRGHTLFELNLVTKEVNKAEYEEINYDISKHNKIRKKVLMRDDCVYIPALNEENALKKFFKKIRK